MLDPVDPDAAIPEEERAAAMRAARKRCIDYKRLSVLDVVVLIVPAIGALLVMLAVNRALARFGMDPSGVPLGIASALLYTGTAALVYRHRYVRYVYEELRARGHDVCPKCGYFRQGLNPTATCPECGNLASESPRAQ